MIPSIIDLQVEYISKLSQEEREKIILWLIEKEKKRRKLDTIGSTISFILLIASIVIIYLRCAGII